MTLATEFLPGTNVRGDVAGASWTFLLPRLELGRVVCLGVPRPESLRTLARLGRQVRVHAPSERRLRAARRAVLGWRLRNIEFSIGGPEAIASEEGADLVVVSGERASRRMRGDFELQAELARVLGTSGRAYYEQRGSRGLTSPPGFERALCRDLQQRGYWQTPLLGEMNTAVPLEDRPTAHYFREHGLEASSFERRPLKQLSEWLGSSARGRRLARRAGWLVSPSGVAETKGPPEYVCEMAREVGLELSGFRYGLSAPGRYSSRKVVLFLFGPGDRLPRYVVKITREPGLNYRLENEYRALTTLSARSVAGSESAPQALFCGRHAGLAMVGETALQGSSLRDRIRASRDFGLGTKVTDWLLELALGTVDPVAVSASDAAEVLSCLLDRFIAIYEPHRKHRRFLTEQVSRLGRLPGRFPVVFQHGDPGTWNMLARPDGGIGVLDWEAAEPQGVPLWDLFYFLRSHAVSAPGAVASRNWLVRSARHFLEDSELNRFAARSIRRYCKELGIGSELVEPLFHTCWMHRALKEATRLPPERLASGKFYALLSLCIERRKTPALRRFLEV